MLQEQGVTPEINKYLRILGALYLVALAAQAYSAREVLAALVEGRVASYPELYIRVLVPITLYPLTAWALIAQKPFRIFLFQLVAVSQILFFLTLGRESVDNWAFGFHVLSLMIYWKYVAREKRRKLDEVSDTQTPKNS